MIGGGPSRTPQPETRRTAYRTETNGRTTEGAQSAPQGAEQAAVSPRHDFERSAKPARRGFSGFRWLIVLLLIAAAAVAGWFWWSEQSSLTATIDSDKHQAVFLSSGQVYFGKLSVVNSEYMRLDNVYYLERQLTVGETAEDDETSGNSFQLLKYSDVLYNSEDGMIISKDDIVRFENLKPDGAVGREIPRANAST